jgi:hypothetical protein
VPALQENRFKIGPNIALEGHFWGQNCPSKAEGGQGIGLYLPQKPSFSLQSSAFSLNEPRALNHASKAAPKAGMLTVTDDRRML